MNATIKNITAILSFAITLSIVAKTPPLPVLKVEFPGKFKKGMY